VAFILQKYTKLAFEGVEQESTYSDPRCIPAHLFRISWQMFFPTSDGHMAYAVPCPINVTRDAYLRGPLPHSKINVIAPDWRRHESADTTYSEDQTQAFRMRRRNTTPIIIFFSQT